MNKHPNSLLSLKGTLKGAGIKPGEIKVPIQAREKSKTGIYHVMLKGINQKIIFEDDEDYEKLLDITLQRTFFSCFLIY